MAAVIGRACWKSRMLVLLCLSLQELQSHRALNCAHIYLRRCGLVSGDRGLFFEGKHAQVNRFAAQMAKARRYSQIAP